MRIKLIKPYIWEVHPFMVASLWTNGLVVVLDHMLFNLDSASCFQPLRLYLRKQATLQIWPHIDWPQALAFSRRYKHLI